MPPGPANRRAMRPSPPGLPRDAAWHVWVVPRQPARVNRPAPSCGHASVDCIASIVVGLSDQAIRQLANARCAAPWPSARRTPSLKDAAGAMLQPGAGAVAAWAAGAGRQSFSRSPQLSLRQYGYGGPRFRGRRPDEFRSFFRCFCFYRNIMHWPSRRRLGFCVSGGR